MLKVLLTRCCCLNRKSTHFPFTQSCVDLSLFRRLKASEALSHPWITEQRSNRIARTANSRTIRRTGSGKSNESSKHSNESKSLTSQNRRVRARELDELIKYYNDDNYNSWRTSICKCVELPQSPFLQQEILFLLIYFSFLLHPVLYPVLFFIEFFRVELFPFHCAFSLQP